MQATKPTEANDELAEAADLDTPLERSGLSARARSAAARLDVTTVGGLLGVHPTKINSIRGLGESYRKEIQARIKEWRARLSVPTAVDEALTAKRGVERVLAGLLEILNGADRVVAEALLGLTSEAAESAADLAGRRRGCPIAGAEPRAGGRCPRSSGWKVGQEEGA